MYLQSLDYLDNRQHVISFDQLSRGSKILVAYLLIDYVFPLILTLLLDSKPLFHYPITIPAIFFQLILLIFAAFIGIVAANATPTIAPTRPTPIQPLPRKLISLFLLICIFVGLAVHSDNLVQWRYGTSLAGSGALLMVAATLQTLLPVVCFWILITDQRFFTAKKLSDRMNRLLLITALVLSMNGLGSIVVTFLFFVICIKPQFALSILFISKKRGTKKRSNWSLFFWAPLSLTMVFALGVYSKSGSPLDQNTVKAYTGLDYLINRHAVHLAIATASIQYGSDVSTLKIPFDTFQYRLNVLLGKTQNTVKPEVSTFSRLALVQFANYEDINPRGGASPGLVGGLTMVFPLPITAIILFTFVFLLAKVVDYVFVRQPPFSWVGAACFAYLPFRYVTDSPFDLLLPGPTLIALAFPIMMSFRRKKYTSVTTEAHKES